MNQVLEAEIAEANAYALMMVRMDIPYSTAVHIARMLRKIYRAENSEFGPRETIGWNWVSLETLDRSSL